jgi:hypothetical protein
MRAVRLREGGPGERTHARTASAGHPAVSPELSYHDAIHPGLVPNRGASGDS